MTRLPATLMLAALAVMVGCSSGAGGADGADGGAPEGEAHADGVVRVLFLTGGGYHDFDRNPSLLLAGLPAGFDVHIARLPDPDALSGLAEADVVLAYTQGELGLSEAERSALAGAVAGGLGFVGLHCALDSHPGWDDYVAMLGARFESHPPFGPVQARVEPAEHAITAGLPAEWTLADEFYHLTDLQLGDATVLMSGVSPEGGERRPVTWCRPHGQGRVVATILGHGAETHGDGRFQQLVGQALAWAAAD